MNILVCATALLLMLVFCFYSQLWALTNSSPKIEQKTAENETNQALISFAQQDWAPTPIDIWKGGVFLKVFVADREVWALIDTGSELTFIDTELARSLGYKITENFGVFRTSHGSAAQALVEDVSFSIPNNIVYRSALSGVDLAPFSKAIDRQVGIVFGKEFLSNVAFYIDTARMHISFRRSGSLSFKDGMQIIEIPVSEDLDIDAIVFGRPARLRIDLGDNGAVSILKSKWDLYFEGDQKYIDTISVDARGERLSVQTALGVPLNIGPISANVPVNPSGADYPGIDGFIGAAFFLKFNTLFDLLAGKVVVKPH